VRASLRLVLPLVCLMHNRRNGATLEWDQTPLLADGMGAQTTATTPTRTRRRLRLVLQARRVGCNGCCTTTHHHHHHHCHHHHHHTGVAGCNMVSFAARMPGRPRPFKPPSPEVLPSWPTLKSKLAVYAMTPAHSPPSDASRRVDRFASVGVQMRRHLEKAYLAARACPAGLFATFRKPASSTARVHLLHAGMARKTLETTFAVLIVPKSKRPAPASLLPLLENIAPHGTAHLLHVESTYSGVLRTQKVYPVGRAFAAASAAVRQRTGKGVKLVIRLPPAALVVELHRLDHPPGEQTGTAHAQAITLRLLQVQQKRSGFATHASPLETGEWKLSVSG
jgi:hypothetical protein